MCELLAGEVQSGLRDAARWLKLFNAAYSEKRRRRVRSLIHRGCPQRDPGARFELLLVSADGHRTFNTQRIDD